MRKRHRIFEGEDLESYFFFIFLEALHAKGETSDELLGFCKANEYFMPPFDIGVDEDKTIDL
jgi:anthranilate phosphoribosyltransferase